MGMLKNLPYTCTLEDLKHDLDMHVAGKYDFMFMPFDYGSQQNCGYAFINFHDENAAPVFKEHFHGKKRGNLGNKQLNVKEARMQGFVKNVEQRRKSDVMNPYTTMPEHMPQIFDLAGN